MPDPPPKRPSRTAIETLEELQKAVFQDLGKTPGSFWDAGRDPKVREAVAKTCPDLTEEAHQEVWDHIEATRNRYSSFETPVFCELVDELAGECLDVMQGTVLAVEHLPLFGTLPNGHFNAVTLPVEGTDEKIVIIERGLLMWLDLIAKCVAYAIPSTADGTPDLNPDHIRASVAAQKELRARFRELMDAMVLHGDPAHMPLARVKEPFRTNAAILCDAARVFIIAHELIHHTRKHGQADITIRDIGNGFHICERSWEQEFEADQLGAQIAMAVMGKRHYPGYGTASATLVYAGINLHPMSMEVLHLAASTVLFGEQRLPTVDTHPLPLARRRSLAKASPLFLPDKQIRVRAHKLSNACAAALRALLEHVYPAYMQLHKDGAAVAPFWPSMFK